MIVVGGDNLVDLLQTGSDEHEVSFSGMRGGSAYNTARAIARQDQNVGFLTPISTDSLGAFLADKMVDDGVKLLADRSNAPTSLAVVTLTDGQAGYQFYRNETAERMVAETSLVSNMPKDAKLFHLTSLAIVEGQDADDWASFYAKQFANGLITTLDPNVRPLLIHERAQYLERLSGLFANTGLLKLSDEDLEWIYPDQSFDDACQSVLKATSAVITIVTKGSEGAIAFKGGKSVSVPAATVSELVDTVGAGDTFMGTTLAQLARMDITDLTALDALTLVDWEKIMTTSAKGAAINCGRKGCQPPTTKELY